MLASDIKLEEIIDFSEGVLNLHGRRLVLHDIHAFAQFRKDLIEIVGVENARMILTRFGDFWGEADAAAMKRIFDWPDIKEWLKAAAQLHRIHGLAKTTMKIIDYDTEEKRYHFEMIYHNSAEAEEHISVFGPGQEAVCWILMGYISGYVSFCLKEKIYFIENKCRGNGDKVCRAVGRDFNSWGKNITPYLKYFKSDDIYGKILKLSEEVKKKDRELRKRLKAVKSEKQNDLVEIKSSSYQKTIELASRVAHYDTTVLITGESGTGKEVLAKHIHANSERKKQQFFAINCGALPDTLLEGELFGYKKGAFTGAAGDREGLLEQAGEGTVFLDEIGDVSAAVQVKLLRVLQEKEILRLGENKPRKIRSRIIAATNRNLNSEIKKGNFREDLYFRLSVVEINIPPLRERNEDILPLCRFFIKKFADQHKLKNCRLDPSCIKYLLDYKWPGNVRELENAIERATIFSQNGLILPECLPGNLLSADFAEVNLTTTSESLENVEKKYINSVLNKTNGNKTKAAELLAISPVTLWRKIKKYRLE